MENRGSLQQRVLEKLKESGEKGLQFGELYKEFPDHLPQSIRGTVLSLVKKGQVQQVSRGVYRAT
jgi:hypothetical protein